MKIGTRIKVVLVWCGDPEGNDVDPDLYGVGRRGTLKWLQRSMDGRPGGYFVMDGEWTINNCVTGVVWYPFEDLQVIDE
jgi:hypothetical protein